MIPIPDKLIYTDNERVRSAIPVYAWLVSHPLGDEWRDNGHKLRNVMDGEVLSLEEIVKDVNQTASDFLKKSHSGLLITSKNGVEYHLRTLEEAGLIKVTSSPEGVVVAVVTSNGKI